MENERKNVSGTMSPESWIEYGTPMIMRINNKKVGVINRLLQVVIFTYIVVYVIWYKKGYQDFDKVISTTTTKVKGIAVTNYSQLNVTIPGGVDGIRIWDVADYVVPPQENDAFFVTTNIVITTAQTHGRCPEAPSESRCSSDADCPAGSTVALGNGMRTGRCIQSDVDQTVKTCEVIAWCPVERDKLPLKDRALLEDSKHFTVFIKNHIEFPKFRQKRRNILETQNPSYLQTCRYNSESEVDRLCPIFILGDIVSQAQAEDSHSFDDIALLGGVIVIHIEWYCNLDYSIDYCLPKYSFSRHDQQTTGVAKGSNFRYSSMYERNGTLYRDLFKAYGIRFIIKVSGGARKFSVVPLLLNIGSGIGLLAISPLICDFIVLHLLNEREGYKERKYSCANVLIDPTLPDAPAQQNEDNCDKDRDDDNNNDDTGLAAEHHFDQSALYDVNPEIQNLPQTKLLKTTASVHSGRP